MTLQRTITLPPMPRGVHLITRLVVPEIRDIETGIAHLFLQHSSASLAINENYDPDVRRDVESFLRSLVPDGWSGFTHTLEGPDDMPAHMKNILIGSSLTLPVTAGELNLGTWQGIYLLEHREHGGSRRIILTLMGE
ncbi:secondary thiamine-phosphate synthase enzyme YjbQ [Nitratifractor sp.]